VRSLAQQLGVSTGTARKNSLDDFRTIRSSVIEGRLTSEALRFSDGVLGHYWRAIRVSLTSLTAVKRNIKFSALLSLHSYKRTTRNVEGFDNKHFLINHTRYYLVTPFSVANSNKQISQVCRMNDLSKFHRVALSNKEVIQILKCDIIENTPCFALL
jgi:hypothetical protein